MTMMLQCFWSTSYLHWCCCACSATCWICSSTACPTSTEAVRCTFYAPKPFSTWFSSGHDFSRWAITRNQGHTTQLSLISRWRAALLFCDHGLTTAVVVRGQSCELSDAYTDLAGVLSFAGDTRVDESGTNMVGAIVLAHEVLYHDHIQHQRNDVHMVSFWALKRLEGEAWESSRKIWKNRFLVSVYRLLLLSHLTTTLL